jgi:Protein of unknown function (DUF2844)
MATDPHAKLGGLRRAVGMSVLLWSLTSFASLGGNRSSVQADAVHFEGTLGTTHTPAYTLQEIKIPTGTVVREYVSSAGQVFAVSWQGPWPPDLKQLLGSHFEEFQQATPNPNRRSGRAPLSVHTPSLVVEQGGHMRAFVGRAYLPNGLPAGVTAESIR